MSAPAPAPVVHRLVILGMPRTKKTSDEFGHAGGRFHKFPAKEWRAWARDAPVQWLSSNPWRPITTRVSARALFYLTPRQGGDAHGYYQGLADFLQDRGILHNDRLIRHWDGSRLLVDRARPRVELELEVLPLEMR